MSGLHMGWEELGVPKVDARGYVANSLEHIDYYWSLVSNFLNICLFLSLPLFISAFHQMNILENPA